MTNNERRLAAEKTIRFYYREKETCKKYNNTEGAILWTENIIGALTIYKIMAEDYRTDKEVLNDILKAV